MVRALSPLLVAVLAAGCNCGDRIGQVHVSVDVAPRALDFGVQQPGQLTRRSVTFTAHGAVANLVSLSLEAEERGSFALGSAPMTLSPEIPVTVEVIYAPRTEGADATSLVARFVDGLDDVVVPVVGRAQLGADPDAGSPDAGAPDAGPPDAGPPDAGLPDAGLPDAGLPDAGLPDAGLSDAGLPDAGLPDAGLADAGPLLCPIAVTTRDVSTFTTALPAVAWAGTGYVLAVDERRTTTFEVSLQRTDPRGALIAGPVPFSPVDGTSSFWPSVSFSGAELGVTWIDEGSPRRVQFARADGNLQKISGSQVTLGAGLVGDPHAHVAWSAALAQWGIAYTDSQGLHFQRFTAAGVSAGVVDLGPRGLSDNGTPLVATPTGWALVTSGTAPRVIELGAGAPTTTSLPGTAGRASIAFGAGQLAVVHDGAPLLQFMRVQGGAVVPNSTLSVGVTATYGPSVPSLGWDGQDFIAVWSQTYSGNPSPLRYARIPPTATSSTIAGAVLTTKSNAGFNSLAVGACGFAVSYGVFGVSDTLEVHP